MEEMSFPSSVVLFTMAATSLQANADGSHEGCVQYHIANQYGFLSSKSVPFFAGLVGQPDFVLPASCIDISGCQCLLFPLLQGYETTKFARSSHPTMGHVYIGQTMKPDEGGQRIDRILVDRVLVSTTWLYDQGTVSYWCCPSVPASGFACLFDVVI